MRNSKDGLVVLYLHALDSNGNKRAECNFENNSWDRQGHFGGKISISLEMEPGFGLNNQTWEIYINCVVSSGIYNLSVW